MTPEQHDQIRLSELIVSSEAFMWLMNGSNHVDLQLSSLRPAYDEWAKLSGGWMRYNQLPSKLAEEVSNDS